MSNSKLVSGIKNGGSGYSKGYGQKGADSYGRPVKTGYTK